MNELNSVIQVKIAYKKFLKTLSEALPVAQTLAKQGKVQLLHAPLPLYVIVLTTLEEYVSYYLLQNPDDTEFEKKWVQAKVEFAQYSVKPQVDQNHPFFQFVKELDEKLQEVDLPASEVKYLFNKVIPAWLTNPSLNGAELFLLFEPERKNEPQFVTISLPFSTLFQSGKALLRSLEQTKEWLFPHIQQKLNELESIEPDWEKTMQHFLEPHDDVSSASASEMKKWFADFQKDWENCLEQCGDQFDETLIRKFLAFAEEAYGSAKKSGKLQQYFPDVSLPLDAAVQIVNVSGTTQLVTRVHRKVLTVSDNEKKPIHDALKMRQELYALVDTFITLQFHKANQSFKPLMAQSVAFRKMFPTKESQETYLREKIPFPVPKDYSQELISLESEKKNKKKSKPTSKQIPIEEKKEEPPAVLLPVIEKKEQKLSPVLPTTDFSKLVTYGRKQLSKLNPAEQIALGQALWHLENLALLSKMQFAKEDRLNAVSILTMHTAWALEQLYDCINPEKVMYRSHNLKVLHQHAFKNKDYPQAAEQFYLGNNWARFFFDIQGQFAKISTIDKEVPPVLSLLVQLAENPESITAEAFESFMENSFQAVFKAAAILMKMPDSTSSDKIAPTELKRLSVDTAMSDDCRKIMKTLSLQLNAHQSSHQMTLLLRQAYANLTMLERSLGSLERASTIEEFNFWMQRSLLLTYESLERLVHAVYFLKENELLKNCHDIELFSRLLKMEELGKLSTLFDKAVLKVRYPLETKVHSPFAVLFDKTQTLRHYPHLDEEFKIPDPKDGIWRLTESKISIKQLMTSFQEIVNRTFDTFNDLLLPALKK